MPAKSPKPVLLCILDGWGHSTDPKDNAIMEANTPFWDKINLEYPSSLLETAGLAVGLPVGQMGNSEVGHMNIGSGRVVMQTLPKIDRSIGDGSLAKNPELVKLVDGLKNTGKSCHILGLISPGGVHSHQAHIYALAKIVASAGVNVKIHAFLDGRDTPPSSAAEYMEKFTRELSGFKNISIATLSGRYYAMDRDKRWDRVELAYNAMVSGSAEKFSDWKTAISASYTSNIFDEFIKPVVASDYNGMDDGDALIMANFRSDRARQTLSALLDPSFDGFKRNKRIEFSNALGMVEYSKDLNKYLDLIFPPEELTQILGEVIADNGLKQLRIAETEKYAHVTFFFNGGRENEFTGEDRILVNSPKVATYDLQPEMSAYEVTDKLVTAIESGKYDLIVVNYANTDMVGHTGIKEAAIKAVEAIDKCLSKLSSAINKTGGCMLISADHGNAEDMVDEEIDQPHTQHTTNPVPLLMVGDFAKDNKVKLKDGSLCDIAPTILKIMGIKQPPEMTGVALF